MQVSLWKPRKAGSSWQAQRCKKRCYLAQCCRVNKAEFYEAVLVESCLTPKRDSTQHAVPHLTSHSTSLWTLSVCNRQHWRIMVSNTAAAYQTNTQTKKSMSLELERRCSVCSDIFIEPNVVPEKKMSFIDWSFFINEQKSTCSFLTRNKCSKMMTCCTYKYTAFCMRWMWMA